MLFLPRLMLKKYALSPSTCGPVVRATSPQGGRSTFTTSAPRSHSTMLAKGPDSTHVRSRIVTSDSGPGMAVTPNYRRETGHTPAAASSYQSRPASGSHPRDGGAAARSAMSLQNRAPPDRSTDRSP